MKQAERKREQHGAKVGQYAPEDGVCECGHHLDEHTAERVTNASTRKKEQPCLACDDEGEPCGCVCFKKAQA